MFYAEPHGHHSIRIQSQWKRHIKYAMTTTAQKMRMRRHVSIIMDVLAVDCQQRQSVLFPQQRQCIINRRLGKRRHLIMQVAIYVFNRGMSAMLHQVSHYGHPLYRRPYSMIHEMFYHQIHLAVIITNLNPLQNYNNFSYWQNFQWIFFHMYITTSHNILTIKAQYNC